MDDVTSEAKNAMTDSSPIKDPVIYIGAKEGDPLHKACEQVFKWEVEEGNQLLVILWHEGWKDGGEEYWKKLEKKIKKVGSKQTKFLVTFFEANLDACRKQEGGSRLSLLFRLLGEDPDHPKGWCRITDFSRLGDAMKAYNPKYPDTELRQRANQILGFSSNLKNGDNDAS